MRITVTTENDDRITPDGLGDAFRKIADELGQDASEVAKAVIGKDAKGINIVTTAKNDGFQDFAVQQFFDLLVEGHGKMVKKAKAKIAEELDRASSERK